jgi:hypothetical protein
VFRGGAAARTYIAGQDDDAARSSSVVSRPTKEDGDASRLTRSPSAEGARETLLADGSLVRVCVKHPSAVGGRRKTTCSRGEARRAPAECVMSQPQQARPVSNRVWCGVPPQSLAPQDELLRDDDERGSDDEDDGGGADDDGAALTSGAILTTRRLPPC